MSLGALNIEVSANFAKFSGDMGKVVAAAEHGFAKIDEAGHKVGEALKSAALGLALGFTLDAIVEKINRTVEAGAHLSDLSKQTGIAVVELGGIGFAASQAGLDLDSVALATNKLNRQLAEAAAGNKLAQEAFTVMGISVKDASGKTKDAGVILGEIATKFSTYKDGPEKAALAIRVFGKAGAEMIAFLDEGGDKLRENIEYFERYSGVSQKTADDSKEFNDQLKKAKLLSDAFATSLTAELLPVMKGIVGYFIKAKEEGGLFAVAISGMRIVLETVAVVGSDVAFVFTQIGKGIIAAGEAAAVLATGGTIASAFAVFDRYNAQAAAARKTLDDFQAHVLGVNEKIGGGRGLINPPLVGPPEKRPPPRLTGGSGGPGRDDFGPLLKSITEKIALDQANLNSVTKLTEGEKLQAKVFDLIDSGYVSLTLAQKLNVDGKLQELLAIEKLVTARDAEAKYLKEAGAENVKFVESQMQVTKTYDDQAKAAQQQLAQFGLSKTELEALTIARMRDTAAALDAKAKQADDGYLDDLAKLWRAQAKAIRDTADALDVLTAKQRTAAAGFGDFFKKYYEDAFDEAKKASTLAATFTSGLEDQLTNLLSGQKTDFHSLMTSVIAEFERLYIVKPLLASIFGTTGTNGLLGGLISLIGGLFTGGGGAGFSGGSTGGSVVGSGGGAAGYAMGLNYVPYDGMSAVLHKGEAIVPAKYNPAAGSSAAGGVVIHNYASVDVSTQQDSDGRLQIMLAAAVKEGARQGHAKVVAEIASGTGDAATALKGRGVSLSGALSRRDRA